MISLASGEAGDISVSAVSGRSLLGLAYLIVMGTVVTFSAYVWLLRHVPPTRVATYAFVNPAVAVLLGWSIAGESLSTGTVLATLVIVAAVATAVSDPPGAPRDRPPEDDPAAVSVGVSRLNRSRIARARFRVDMDGRLKGSHP